jgi:type II secretory pathway pseudopilin PulG
MKHHEGGATFNELIISLAVVGIVAAISLPNLIQVVPNYRLASAARSLLAFIQEAKSRAVYRGTICYLDFDLDGDGDLASGGCVLWEDRNGNLRKQLLERNETSFELKVFPGVQFQAYPYGFGGPKRGPNNTNIAAGGGDGVSFNQNRIKFNPNGTCSTGTIYLHNRRGRTFAVRLRYNGLAQLWFHDGHKWVRR